MRIPYEDNVTSGPGLIPLSDEIAAAILLTLEAGWEIASAYPEIHAAAGEVVITERLRDAMRQVVNNNGLHPKLEIKVVVLLGSESRSRPEISTPDGRTDIPIFIIEIFAQYGVHDPHAIIECKRIAGSNTNLCRLYVVEGIDRFQTGKYAQNHRVAFMVGYLISGDAGAAVSGINQYLTGKGRQVEHLEPSKIIKEFCTWKSGHPRTGSSPIELHHAFFRLKAAPS
ncbi:MAG: hypothetical protein OXN26_19455 [Gammaproteobacteria bacterium]|nr:hypothetical protein [Gammaproteobacteria bacterium]